MRPGPSLRKGGYSRVQKCKGKGGFAKNYWRKGGMLDMTTSPHPEHSLPDPDSKPSPILPGRRRITRFEARNPGPPSLPTLFATNSTGLSRDSSPVS
jgi:hypothetical protein